MSLLITQNKIIETTIDLKINIHIYQYIDIYIYRLIYIYIYARIVRTFRYKYCSFLIYIYVDLVNMSHDIVNVGLVRQHI